MATNRPNPHHAAFRSIFAAMPNGQKIWADQLFLDPALPSTARATHRKHLISLLNAEPALLEKVLGIYPNAHTIIDLVEHRFGMITEANLDISNRHAASIVRGIAQPVIEQFVDTTLASHITNGQVSISKLSLMTFLLEDFTEFSKGAGNGLVSIAGTLNEYLFMRAMRNGGMVEGTHFMKTGKNSEADLIVQSNAGTRPQLGVEIKSYHARERLLRGLHDITGAKVGIGFFKDSNEFNLSRTQTLLQTHAAAIYMPQATLSAVNPAAAALTSNENIAFQSKLYRPIERFVSDMNYFYNNALLPRH